MNKKLPIGSVVELKKKTKEYFIIVGNKNNTNYYLCVKYPYGLIEKELYEIQEKEINNIIFMGNINY